MIKQLRLHQDNICLTVKYKKTIAFIWREILRILVRGHCIGRLFLSLLEQE